MYQDRRDVLCDGLNSAGWAVTPPKATMFVWAKIPAPFDQMGSLEFSKLLPQGCWSGGLAGYRLWRVR